MTGLISPSHDTNMVKINRGTRVPGVKGWERLTVLQGHYFQGLSVWNKLSIMFSVSILQNAFAEAVMRE